MRFTAVLCVIIAVACVTPFVRGDLLKAKDWLLSQRIIKDGSPTLIDSYENNDDICYTYDQAIAAIALLATGEHGSAKSILEQLKSLQTEKGTWYNSYYGHTLQVQEWLQHAGPVLWVVLACKYYEVVTADTTFHTMAIKALDWSLTLQQEDGGINGGLDWNGIDILPWASTEHNIDLYCALVAFGYSNYTHAVGEFIYNSLWDNENGRFYAGRNDPCNSLDVNTWGYLALGDRYRRALHYASRTTVYTSGSSDPVQNVTGYDFSGPFPDECANRWCWCWTPVEDIWFEGVAQMAAAMNAAHNKNEAEELLRNIEKVQTSNGGIRYSLKGTFNGFWGMSTQNSVASTGWYVIAKENVNPMRYSVPFMKTHSG